MVSNFSLKFFLVFTEIRLFELTTLETWVLMEPSPLTTNPYGKMWISHPSKNEKKGSPKTNTKLKEWSPTYNCMRLKQLNLFWRLLFFFPLKLNTHDITINKLWTSWRRPQLAPTKSRTVLITLSVLTPAHTRMTSALGSVCSLVQLQYHHCRSLQPCRFWYWVGDLKSKNI